MVPQQPGGLRESASGRRKPVCYCKPSQSCVREARVTWRSRAEIAEKHRKTADHSTLINSPVWPPYRPFFPQTQGTGVDFALLRGTREGGSLGIGGGRASEVWSQVRPALRSLGWDWLSPREIKTGRGEDQKRFQGCARVWRADRHHSGKDWRSQPGSLGGTPMWQKREWIRHGFSQLWNRPLRSLSLHATTSKTAPRIPSLPGAMAARAPTGRLGGHSVGTHPGSGGRRSGSAGPRDRSAEGPGAGRRRRSEGAAAGKRPAGVPGARSARDGSWPRGTRARAHRRANGRRPRRRRGSRSRRLPRPRQGEGN